MRTKDLAEVVKAHRAGEPWPEGVWITAFGGRPIRGDEDLLECLGESALLTYLNPKGRSRRDLGALCMNLGHDWCGHWVNLTLTFFGYLPAVQHAWTRDRRFWISWSEATDAVWSATGSIKDWKRYTSHSDDPSFCGEVRAAMRDARACLSTFSDYFDA